MSHISEKLLSEYLLENQVQLYRLAYSYLQNEEDALDAVQTTACKVLEKQSTLRNPDALSTWIRRILVNVCTDMLRQRNKVIYMPTEDLDVGSYEDALPGDSSLTEQINALPTEVATVIRLRYFEECSLKEISAITDSNLSTVKTRLYTGLKKLRILVESEAIV